jgi:hypothetical protein
MAAIAGASPRLALTSANADSVVVLTRAIPALAVAFTAVAGYHRRLVRPKATTGVYDHIRTPDME